MVTRKEPSFSTLVRGRGRVRVRNEVRVRVGNEVRVRGRGRVRGPSGSPSIGAWAGVGNCN